MLYPALNVKKYFMPSVLFFTTTEKINYEPLMLFGIEDLVSLLHSERDIEDE
ncbi:hypothetical protein AGMMS49573_05600 [Endomicrobiia bacterium]|nr:hypothetical protein [Candidatus Endomicrobium trichonymphae]GHT03739.1 hypothetical protein AGMMS49523_00010 [Endomicrobiia bacterium]GHT08992.1 hypothetical protein AGMMS49532_05570 [Endomicrobiia bacterium]GHT11309.1 hypothetical protein AGMMS49571_01430 [Endomicrobiia bacterium]GHT16308.1 hypothetical protein AGMMS49573_05600 [Endomicrobiia bacterium]GHT19543.1 hypothetical protein AGMMS49929_03500 [Endomicrobiia bacterium]